ncbi:thioredoxin [archaeon]|jgi:thioredoxin 1|nr:thioredoxin [archaeon]MBT6698518.1 thioredoxin [archaeon]
MVKALNAEEFNKLVKEDGAFILVDFWASWCGPCKALAPVLEEVSSDEQFEGLTFAKLSTEDHPEISQEFGIRGIPNLKIFKGGKEVGEIVGFNPKPALTEKLKEIYDKNK